MTSQAHFLQAILDDPEDDAPRLVFADWLDERGDPALAPRAELIRVQVELARGTAEPARHRALQAREKELLAHARDWLGPLAGAVSQWRFTRGLPEVWLDAEPFAGSKFQGLAVEWFPRAWVQDVSLFRPTARWREVLDSPL